MIAVVAARLLLPVLDLLVRSLIKAIDAVQQYLIRSLEAPPEPIESLEALLEPIEALEPVEDEEAFVDDVAIVPWLETLPALVRDELQGCRVSLLGKTCLIVSPVLETGYADTYETNVYLGALLNGLRSLHSVEAVVVWEPGQILRFLFMAEESVWHLLRVAA